MSKKSILSGLLLAGSVILLAACGQQASQTSGGESTDATVQTSSSEDKKAEQPKINYHVAYQNVLESYKERVKTAQAKQMPQSSLDDKEEAYINSILFDYDGRDIAYTFYDINKDGKKELLIKQDTILLGIYYLTDQGTLLVKSGGVAGRGGERRILIPYENGAISYLNFNSPRPEAIAKTYLFVDGRYQEASSVNYDLRETKDPSSLQGLDGIKKVDLEGLNWMTFDDASASRPFIDLEEQAKEPGAHLAEIYQKNFSSIKGTWKNNNGVEVTFDENGFTNGLVLTDTVPKIVNNMVRFGMTTSSGVGGASVILIPKGVVHPDNNVGDTVFKDASDSSKERLLITQSVDTLSNPNEFYYKVSE